MNRWSLVVRLVLAAIALVLAAPAVAYRPSSVQQQPIAIDRSLATVELDTQWVWLDPQGRASIDEVASGRVEFTPLQGEGFYTLRPEAALWLRVRLQPSYDAYPHWVLAFPSPVLDKLTVFTSSTAQRWQSFSAGDHVPVALWPEAGRYPVFGLQFSPGQPLDIYVRVEHGTSLALPVRLASRVEHDQRTRLEYMGLGIVFGGLALLVLGSIRQAWSLRDRSHAWYAVYGLLALVAVSAYTGVAGDLLWGNATAWADAAPGCLALLAGSVGLFIVGQFTLAGSRARFLSDAIRTVAAVGLLLAPAYVWVLPRQHGMAVLGVYLMTVAVLCMVAAGVSWRRGEPVGRWMMAGGVPLALAVGLALARLFGLVDGWWLTEYTIVAAIGWNLPMLKAALNNRLRERRSAQLRQQALASHDPLTGLPKTAPFRARLRRVLSRYGTTREPACLLAVGVANLPAIKVSRGSEAAEECLLRSVIKIQKLVRDVDTTARVGDNCFAILLEGVHSRSRVNELGSHLVASGLIQDPDHPGDPVLQFHVAAALLTELPAPGVTLVEELMQLLATMSPRTRRPIRFLAQPGQERSSGFMVLPPHTSPLDRIPEVI